MKNPYIKKLINTLPFIIMGRQNPVTGGLLYLITNKSTAWFVLHFIILGAFIVLVNAALEWSNHNAMEAIIVAGGVIVLIILSLFAVKNKRASAFLSLLFGAVFLAYIYYAEPKAQAVTQETIEKGAEIYGEVKNSMQ